MERHHKVPRRVVELVLEPVTDLTTREAGKVLGVSRTTIIAWRADTFRPRLERLLRLNVPGVSRADILRAAMNEAG